MKNGNTMRYTGTAKSIHWGMAILLLGSMCLGFFMVGLPFSPEKLKAYSWHKWAGVTAFLLALVRIGWRFTHRPPELPDSMPTSLQRIAHAAHALLYLLMFAIPIAGWLMSSAKGFQTVYFSIFPIPDMLTRDKELGDLLHTAHLWLNLLFIAVLVGHVAAALKHHFIDKDDILVRMLPNPNQEK